MRSLHYACRRRFDSSRLRSFTGLLPHVGGGGEALVAIFQGFFHTGRLGLPGRGADGLSPGSSRCPRLPYEF